MVFGDVERLPAVPQRGRKAPEACAYAGTTIGMVSQTSNVIMQLALPSVGRAVVESRVVSGSAHKQPIKRSRTTGTFLAVAILGSETDKERFGAAIHEVHSHVHSRPSSPVKYSGNDPQLQLWVAMCLFHYFLDQYELLYGPLTEAQRDRILRSAAPLGTMLQVRPSMWPGSYVEFEKHWHETLPKLSMDDDVIASLQSLADLSFLRERYGLLGAMASRLLGPHYQFMTKGLLPPRFRELMRWPWSEKDQDRFERNLRWYRLFDAINPAFARFVGRIYLLDMRIRHGLGLPLLGRLRLAE